MEMKKGSKQNCKETDRRDVKISKQKYFTK